MGKQRTWDEARARALYDEGRTDLEIAEMVGASCNAIGAWRHKNALSKNGGARAAGLAASERADGLPAPAPEQPTAREKSATSEEPMKIAVLAEVLETAASQFPGAAVLLPGGGAVTKCRLDVLYGGTGTPMRAVVYLA